MGDARHRLAPVLVVRAVLDLDHVAAHSAGRGRRIQDIAVVHLRHVLAARAGQRDGAALRHRQGAVNRLDAVVACLGALVQRVRERVLTAAHERLAARHFRGVAFAANEAVARQRHRAVGQLLAVIHLGIRRGGQGDVAAGHLELVIAVRRVVVVVAGAHVHRLLAHVGDARHRLAPVLLVRAVLDLDHVVGLDARGRGRRLQRRAVVHLRDVVAARAHQRDVVALVNCQLTVHILNSIVVGVLTDLRCARHNHTRIYASICSLTRQRDARQGVTALQTLNGHISADIARVSARRSLGLAVVGVSLINRSDCQFGLLDRQGSIDIVNCVVAGVLANLCIARNDNSCIDTGIGLFAGQSDARQSVAALETAHRNIRIKARCVDADRTLGLAVVCIGLRFRRNRQSRRLDLQPTVRIGRVVSVIRAAGIIANRDREVGHSQSHCVTRIRVDIGAFGLSCRIACHGHTCRLIHLFACQIVFHGITRHALLTAGVCLRSRIADYLHSKYRLPHRVQVVVRVRLVRGHGIGNILISGFGIIFTIVYIII